MTTDIVLADTSSEVAVTGYLQQARDWLATAVEQTGPEQIAMVRAEIATAAEATKQLRLSKEIRGDAVEMVRRAEYAVSKSIRKGQVEGTIRSLKDNAAMRGSHPSDAITGMPSVKDIAPDFYNNGMEIGHLADATPEEFEAAITEAKAEGNLSRANLVRKVKGYCDGTETRQQRAAVIAELAAKGWASRQMVDRIGTSEETIRKIARDYEVEIPGDRALRQQKRINSNQIVENLVIGMEGSAMSLDLVNLTDLDQDQTAYWATSLTESLQKLNRFAKQIKEIAQ